jgi:hypothetical protein
VAPHPRLSRLSLSPPNRYVVSSVHQGDEYGAGPGGERPAPSASRAVAVAAGGLRRFGPDKGERRPSGAEKLRARSLTWRRAHSRLPSMHTRRAGGIVGRPRGGRERSRSRSAHTFEDFDKTAQAICLRDEHGLDALVRGNCR